MRLRFSTEAMADIEELKSWLKPRAPQGYERVTARLTATIRSLKQNPDSGRQTSEPHIREAVEVRYGFVIPYAIRGDSIWILRIYSARRYPLNYGDFPKPGEPN